jgi:hypothetical protein
LRKRHETSKERGRRPRSSVVETGNALHPIASGEHLFDCGRRFSLADAESNQLGSRGDAELHEHLAEVVLDGARGVKET